MPLIPITVIYGAGALVTPAGALATGTITLQPVQETPSPGYTIVAAAETFALVDGQIDPAHNIFNTNGQAGLQALVYEQIVGVTNPQPYVVSIPTSGTLDLSQAPRGTLGVTTPLYIPVSVIAAVGDLLVGTGAGAVARLPVGANGLVLTADSTQPDGMRWAAAGTGTVTAVSAGSARVTVGGVPTVTPSVDVVLDATAADIAALGSQAAGSSGKVPDAAHVHPMPRLDQVLSPTAAVALGSQKITGLANGSAAQDAAAYGQIVPLATATTKGDLLAATGAAAIARLGVGGDGDVLTAQSGQATGLAWVAPTVYKPTVRSAYITSGTVIPPNTSSAWQVLNQSGGAAFEIDIPAAIGDWVEIGYNAMCQDSNGTFYDIGVVVSTTIVRLLGQPSLPAASGFQGDPAWYPIGGFLGHAGPRGFVVTSGDRDGSNVRFVVATNSNNTGKLFAEAAYPFYWVAKNLGPPN